MESDSRSWNVGKFFFLFDNDKVVQGMSGSKYKPSYDTVSYDTVS